MAELGKECRKRSEQNERVTLQEMLPDHDNVWGKGVNGRYLFEFVVPLMRRQREVMSREEELPEKLTMPSTLPQRLRLPGSDWLYAKLYSGRARHDDLLGGPVQEFANQAIQSGLIDRWFFVRYADPEPHLRLRFHGDPRMLLLSLLPRFASWAEDLVKSGHVRKLALDTYDREVERYGGVEGVQLAERLFAADSVGVVGILALRGLRTMDFTLADAALITVDTLLRNIGLDAAERLDLYKYIRQGQETVYGGELARLRESFHGYRKSAQRMIGDEAWLDAQLGGEGLRECLRLRAMSVIPLGEDLRTLIQEQQLCVSRESFLASCVHMHCNRLLGINRPLEFEVTYYLDRTLESLGRYMPPGISID